MGLQSVLKSPRTFKPYISLLTVVLLFVLSLVVSTSPSDDAQDVLSLEADVPSAKTQLEVVSSIQAQELAPTADVLQVYDNDFNATRCAELHNRIVSIVASVPREPLNKIEKFFDAYSAEEERLRKRLSTPLIDFLSQIYVAVPPADAPWAGITFTPRLAMPHPDSFWLFEDWELGDEYILLYPDPEETTGGIFFDMETNLISMVTLPDSDMYDSPWHYLELALERYLAFFEVGKYHLPKGSGHGHSDAGEEDAAMSVKQVLQAEVEEALELYDFLLESISLCIEGSHIYDEPLVDMETLTRWKVQGFAYEFLSRARTPSFKYIAPGITVFNSDSFNEIMTLDGGSFERLVRDRHLDEFDTVPMILFPGDTPVQNKEDPLFDLRHPYIINNMTGVYLQPDFDWGDTVEFILPYSIGEHGHVRYGSARIFDSDPTRGAVRGHGELFQHGRCPFFKSHFTRLGTLLHLWIANIRSGAFTIGPDGVQGGMDLYREADTEDSDILFSVQVCF